MPSTHTLPNGVTLSRDAFISHYVAAWLASNEVACAMADDWWEANRGARTPLDEAMACAERAWQDIETLLP